MVSVVWKGLRVLVTQQLASSYEVDNDRISKNYHENKERFVLGKHYFKLEGEELRQFKDDFRNSELVGKNASQLYLWTEKGSWLHAKSLGTDKAWEAYDLLIDDYFRVKELSGSTTPSYMIEDPEERAKQWIEEYRTKKLIESEKFALEAKVAEDAPKIAYVETILKSRGTVTTSQIAKDYGLSANELNKILKEEKIQYKVNDQWLLYSNYDDKGYTQSYTIDIVRSDGRPDVKMVTRWTQAGRLFIHDVLKKRGIKANIEKDYFDAR